MKLPVSLRRNKETLKRMYGLNVKCSLKFRGDDSREARRWLYDFLRSNPTMFNDFDGPKDPIVMSFCTASAEYLRNVLRDLFPTDKFQDVEIRVEYFCFTDSDHCGSFKFGNRKKGFLGGLTGRTTESGQVKIA